MLYATVLWQHRDILSDKEAMDREKVNGNHNIGHIRFLVDAYRPKYYYFEVIECIRRLLLASVIGIIASEKSAASSVLGFLISSLFIYVFSKLEPFNLSDDNDLCVVLSYSLMLMFLAALLIKISVVQEDSQDQEIFGLILIVIFVAGPVSLIAQTTKSTITAIIQRFDGAQSNKSRTDLPSSNDLGTLESMGVQHDIDKREHVDFMQSDPPKMSLREEKRPLTRRETKINSYNKEARLRLWNGDLSKPSSKEIPRKIKKHQPQQEAKVILSKEEKCQQIWASDISDSPKSSSGDNVDRNFPQLILTEAVLREPSSSRTRESQIPPPRLNFSDKSFDDVVEPHGSQKFKPRKSIAVIARSINKSKSVSKNPDSITTMAQQDKTAESFSLSTKPSNESQRNKKNNKASSPIGTFL